MNRNFILFNVVPLCAGWWAYLVDVEFVNYAVMLFILVRSFCVAAVAGRVYQTVDDSTKGVELNVRLLLCKTAAVFIALLVNLMSLVAWGYVIPVLVMALLNGVYFYFRGSLIKTA